MRTGYGDHGHDDGYEAADDRYGEHPYGGPVRPHAGRAPHRGPRTPASGRGVPDGLLLGLLAFLLGVTLLVWSAAGFAGLLAHGSWPAGVTFSRTPLAMRHLIGQPHDLSGAWSHTPKGQLSGYGLFWGLFISQLMVLFVLGMFVIGTVARWRARRALRRAEDAAARSTGRTTHGTGPALQKAGASPSLTKDDVPLHAPHTAPGQDRPAQEGQQGTPGAEASPRVQDDGVPSGGAPGASGSAGDTPGPSPTAAVASGAAPAVDDALPAALGASVPPARRLVLGQPDARRPLAIGAVRDADGPVLVVTSDPTVWSETKDARAKLGPVLLYDPLHRCDTPSRLHWSPSAGCQDRAIAAERARALLAPVRPTAKIDTAVADTAETLLRSFLHAAAVDGKQFRHVHRWAQGTQVQDAVRILRSHPKATSGTAGELEAALTAHPERRDIAQELTTRALSALSSVHIRDACTPNRTDAVSLDSFVDEGGTLYLVGEAIEDPKARPGAMPLLTALASSVVEHGRRMAERSSSGRLDPPLTLVLDDIAAVAPLPQLPDLLATGAERGLPTFALLRSREQARARWPHTEMPF